MTLDEEELEGIKLETKKTDDLREFVKEEEIAPPFLERPYYIVPEDEHAVEGYQVIHGVMKKESSDDPRPVVRAPCGFWSPRFCHQKRPVHGRKSRVGALAMSSRKPGKLLLITTRRSKSEFLM